MEKLIFDVLITITVSWIDRIIKITERLRKYSRDFSNRLTKITQNSLKISKFKFLNKKKLNDFSKEYTKK